MSPVPVGEFLTKDGKTVLSFTYPTDKELEEHPEHAIGVLLRAIWIRSYDITSSGEPADVLVGLQKLLQNWVYGGPPLTREAGRELALQQNNEWSRALVLMRIGKKGRPIKSRHTAIKALFRKYYLNKSWDEVTRRLCQCGKPHDDGGDADALLRVARCQANIAAGVRHFKRELKKYDVAFPPSRPKKIQPMYKASEPTQAMPRIPTLEESSGALRVADTYAAKHPAIAILLDGEPMPAIPMDDDESDALCLFNPWVQGWLPLWFPSMILRGSEPIQSVYLDSEQRFKWFDKTFKKFAGSEWQLKGDLDSKRLVIARTLLQMYRAARDETVPDLADL